MNADDAIYGCMIHGNGEYWFEGPMPSMRCARMLIQMYEQKDGDTIPDQYALIHRWPLMSKPDDLWSRRFRWAIELTAPVETSWGRRCTLDAIRRVGIKPHTAPGPWFPEPPEEPWQGTSV